MKRLAVLLVWLAFFVAPYTALSEDFIDRRFLDEITKSGFFDKLWGEKS